MQVVDLFAMTSATPRISGLLWLIWVDRKSSPFFPTLLSLPEVALLITDPPGGWRTWTWGMRVVWLLGLKACLFVIYSTDIYQIPIICQTILGSQDEEKWIKYGSWPTGAQRGGEWDEKGELNFMAWWTLNRGMIKCSGCPEESLMFCLGGLGKAS